MSAMIVHLIEELLHTNTNQIILHYEAKVTVGVFIVNEVCSLLD
jgi:hypothetical protein